jgi:hypothetical protein
MEFFFERCHRPYIARRHGEIAYVNTLRDFKRFFDEGELLLVSRNGQRVGGALNRAAGDTYEILYFGILDGEEARLHDGTTSANYFFSYLEACRRDFRRLDLGRCRPFLNDGIMYCKRKWKGRLVADPAVNRPIQLALGRLNHAACHVLERDPFVVCINGRLTGMVYLGEQCPHDPKALKASLRMLSHPGLDAMIIYLMGPEWTARRAMVEAVALTLPQPTTVAVQATALEYPADIAGVGPTIKAGATAGERLKESRP